MLGQDLEKEASKFNINLSDGDEFSDDGDEDGDEVMSQVAKAGNAGRDEENILVRYSDKIEVGGVKKGVKTTKDKAQRATVEQVLDPRTMRFLGKIFNRGVISGISGCISTGKEANVYRGDCGDRGDNRDDGREYAVKIYKTSILVFKDRERYVDGEFRFRNTKNQSNPRKMVKVWAEKEFRNLKRLYLHGIPCPEPVDLYSHVLVMEYLTRGDGQPSPKLRDYGFGGVDEIVQIYHQMLFYMRRMYQECRLVHADLSEYNSIVHQNKLYIIDVSQSVEPEHPMALDFLRMDIKNINDFFSRKKINVYPERMLFKYITEDGATLGIESNSDRDLAQYLEILPLKNEASADDEIEDEIFRSVHLVRSLNNLDERDFEKFSEGKMITLNELILNNGALKNGVEVNALRSSSNLDIDAGSTEGDNLVDGETSLEETSPGIESESETDSQNEDSGSDDSDSSSDEIYGDRPPKQPSLPKGKKFESKDDKKARKEAAKLAKQEKRKTKLKKHIKKKIINKRKTK